VAHDSFERDFLGARSYLALAHPFFSALLAHFRITPDIGAETAFVTTGSEIHINPDFFHGLQGVAKRGFLLAHEVLHVALGVFWRGRFHDAELSNVAHDYVVNSLLVRERSDWLIEGALHDTKFDGMPYEEVYALLKKNPCSPAKPVMLDLRFGHQAGSTLPGELDTASMEHLWSQRIISAALLGQSAGRGSKAAEALVDGTLNPRVRWQDHLFHAVQESFASSYHDWSRPHRRSEALGVHLPRPVELGYDCAVFCDTSGSISEENLGIAVAETDQILRLCGGRVRWMEGDEKILRDEWIGGPPEKVCGRGGTSFVPLFEALDDSPTRLLVIFTDTFGDMPKSPPRFPVIWAVYKPVGSQGPLPPVPFGETIAVPESQL
jgi:predicted metal-dependent peptidase